MLPEARRARPCSRGCARAGYTTRVLDPDRARPGRRPRRRASTSAPTTTWSSRSRSTSCSRGCARDPPPLPARRTTWSASRDLEIDTAGRIVARARRRAIALSAREYALLEYLALRRGQVVTRAEIWEHVYDFAAEPSSNVVDVYIGYLRKKIDDGHAVQADPHPPRARVLARRRIDVRRSLRVRLDRGRAGRPDRGARDFSVVVRAVLGRALWRQLDAPTRGERVGGGRAWRRTERRAARSSRRCALPEFERAARPGTSRSGSTAGRCWRARRRSRARARPRSTGARPGPAFARRRAARRPRRPGRAMRQPLRIEDPAPDGGAGRREPLRHGGGGAGDRGRCDETLAALSPLALGARRCWRRWWRRRGAFAPCHARLAPGPRARRRDRRADDEASSAAPLPTADLPDELEPVVAQAQRAAWPGSASPSRASAASPPTSATSCARRSPALRTTLEVAASRDRDARRVPRRHRARRRRIVGQMQAPGARIC